VLGLPAKEPKAEEDFLPEKQKEKEGRHEHNKDDSAGRLLKEKDNRDAHQKKNQGGLQHGGEVGLATAPGKMTVQAAPAQHQRSQDGHHRDVRHIKGKFTNLPGLQREEVREKMNPDVVGGDHGGSRQQTVNQLEPDLDLAKVPEVHGSSETAFPFRIRQAAGRCSATPLASTVGPPFCSARSAASPCQATAKRAASKGR